MRGTPIRLVLLVLLIAAELLAISISFDAQTLLERSNGDFIWLGYAGYGAKILVAGIVALLIALGPRLRDWTSHLQAAADQHRYLVSLALHLGAFVCFLYVTSLIFSSSATESPPTSGLSVLWIALLIAVVALWLGTVAPWRFWQGFVVQELLTFGFAAIVALLAWAFTLVTQDLWDPLSGITFDWAAWLLHLFYADIVIEPENRILGAGSFVVEIAAVCSGYEGIGLITIFTGLYLSVFRSDFRFPQALLLIPIGVLTIWLFNVFRIAALIVIGAEWSPALALGGFHSQAGWISFILVAVGMLLLAHNSKLITVSGSTTARQPINYRMALLIPLIVLLATTLLTSALTITVDWWYPLRVICTAVALALLWRHFRRIRIRINWIAVAIGALVFALWLILVPDDPSSSAEIDGQLAQLSTATLWLWLLFRILGAVLTVPLAEELAFRGYLFELFDSDDETGSAKRFPWLALLVSSVLFGLLHNIWIAGILAGFGYGIVRWYRGNIGDAFVAHATTNLLLSAYVLTTRSWSLW